jgi:hypothetical protein
MSIFDALSEYSDKSWYRYLLPQRFDSTYTMELREAAIGYYAALNENLTPSLFAICQEQACRYSGFAYYFSKIEGADILMCKEACNPDNYNGWKKKLAILNNQRF